MNEISIRKEDIYRLVDKMNEKETNLAYKILKGIVGKSGINKNLIIEADNSPLTEEEKAELSEVVKEESVDWEDVKRELDL